MNTNRTDMEEAMLTAYALNELDADGRAAAEAVLARDPAARAWVEEVRRTATLLESELGAEECPSLTPAQSGQIRRRLLDAEPAGWFPSWLFQPRRIGGAAAILALLTLVLLPFLPGKNPAAGTLALKTQALRGQTDTLATNADPRPAAAPPAPMAVAPVQIHRSLNLPSPSAPAEASAAPDMRPTAAVAMGAVRAAPNRYQGGAKKSREMLKRLRQDSDGFNTESYAPIQDNPFLSVQDNPLSTFSVDVDTASYANVRRFLTENGTLPPPDAVRIEEMINYFPYSYAAPKPGQPFSVTAEVAGCPWNGEHRLMRIGLKGREIPVDRRPPGNLVFLVDVSGSMDEPNKLPLLVESLKLLAARLTENDRVAIVVYAGAAGVVLPSTPGSRKEEIMGSLDRLQAGGSTHGSEGIRLAYETAARHFIKGGINRVILCTDGDFNVGTTSQGELKRLIAEKAKGGVFLSVLGFGMGNYKDATMETLADRGNGNYAYIDTLNEARKVLVEQMSGTLLTIAKDVKIQIEFNPAKVGGYRLIGYENRLLAREDFNDDRKDAGEIGAGHTVTALYEIVPAGLPIPAPGVDPLKYQKPAKPSAASRSNELLTLKLRYKQPDSDTSTLLSSAVTDTGLSFGKASPDFKFAAAVAEFGMLLRGSPHMGDTRYASILEHAGEGLGRDPEGHRAGFIALVRTARGLAEK